MFEAVIFDFDGLIADTESAVYEVWREFYEAQGEELEISDWVRCVGSDWGKYNPGGELERRTGKSYDWEVERAAMKAKEAIIVENLRPFPGVETLLEEVANAGLGCAVGSSSPHAWVDPWLDKFGIRKYFQEVVCLEDGGGKAKPDPAIFNEAVKRLNVAPEKVLVLEDSLNGLRAAQAAGIPCVVVPNRITAGLDFEGAKQRLETLEGATLATLNS